MHDSLGCCLTLNISSRSAEFDRPLQNLRLLLDLEIFAVFNKYFENIHGFRKVTLFSHMGMFWHVNLACACTFVEAHGPKECNIALFGYEATWSSQRKYSALIDA